MDVQGGRRDGRAPGPPTVPRAPPLSSPGRGPVDAFPTRYSERGPAGRQEAGPGGARPRRGPAYVLLGPACLAGVERSEGMGGTAPGGDVGDRLPAPWTGLPGSVTAKADRRSLYRATRPGGQGCGSESPWDDRHDQTGYRFRKTRLIQDVFLV